MWTQRQKDTRTHTHTNTHTNTHTHTHTQTNINTDQYHDSAWPIYYLISDNPQRSKATYIPDKLPEWGHLFKGTEEREAHCINSNANGTEETFF